MASKKKAKPRRTTSAPDAHQRRQERLEARRLERARALEARARAARRARLIRLGVIAALVAGFVYLFFMQTRPQGPESIRGHAIERFGDSGVNEHVTGTVEYDSTPPTHGPHGSPVACGVHAEPIPHENQVHLLEHGVVGIQYRPSLAPDDIRSIEAVVRETGSRTFSAPYPGMPTAIAVTSWGELMRLDSLDLPAINDYVEAFRGEGPEDVACPNDSDSPFRAGGEGGSPDGQ
jgi:hypothetical protein